MVTLNVQQAVGPELELYHRYDGATRCQPIYLYLDLENGNAWADYDPEVGAGIHEGAAAVERVQHRVVLRWHLPLVIPATVNLMLYELTETLQQVLDGAAVEMDGTDKVGVLTPRARYACRCVEDLIDGYPDDFTEIDAADWLSAEDLEGFGPDTDMDALIERLEEAAWTSDDGRVVIVGLRHYLETVLKSKRGK